MIYKGFAAVTSKSNCYCNRVTKGEKMEIQYLEINQSNEPNENISDYIKDFSRTSLKPSKKPVARFYSLVV